MSYYFKLPIYAELTDPQKAVLDEPNAVAITGGPGTGKSVVSLWRHIRNHSIGTKKSLILTYTKTLERYLSECAAKENAEAGRAVKRTTGWSFDSSEHIDEIIVDEAQDNNNDCYTYLKRFVETVSYGADEQQILYPEHSSSEEQLLSLFPDNKFYELDENFRNSYEIMQFTSAALPKKLISNLVMEALQRDRSTGIKPKCLVTGGIWDKRTKGMIDIINEFESDTHNIGIFLPKKSQVRNCHALLLSKGVKCTMYIHDGEEILDISGVHVTTFKSAKGIEFDTVILPDFQDWKLNIQNLNIVEEKDYYVAFTRAKRNLFLISSTSVLGIDPTTYEIENL